MKRIHVTIDGEAASEEEIKQLDRAANREFSAAGKKPRPKAPRRRVPLTAEEKEAKRKQTERNRILDQIERDAREHQRLMRRLVSIQRKIDRDEAKRRKIVVSYRVGREPNFKVVCPKALYRRVHPFAPPLLSRPAKTAADGMRNLVFRYTSRGFGKKDAKTRAYKIGEAGRSARYIARPDGLEETSEAVFTNLLGDGVVSAAQLAILDQQEIVGFFDALEMIERATGLSHVYSHIIVALPFELGPEGRSAAVRRICDAHHKQGLPFLAAMHKPDPEGNQRNFHLHMIVATRPAERLGAYSWAFNPEQYSEFISAPGRSWARYICSDAFNAELRTIGSGVTYSAVSEAERGLVPSGESHKGQKQVALERAAAADDAKVQELLRYAAHHLLQMAQRFAEWKKRRERERKRKLVTVAATKTLEAVLGAPAVPDAPVAMPVQVSTDADLRVNQIQRSQMMLDASDLTDGVKRLVAELKSVPQKAVVALYKGNLQIAFEDQSLEAAVREAVDKPLVHKWLVHLAENVKFDHAHVPTTWNQITLGFGDMRYRIKTSYWAVHHGAKVLAPQDQTSAFDRGRGAEI